MTSLGANRSRGTTPLKSGNMATTGVTARQKSASSTSQTGNGQTYRGPFAAMTLLFFLWGFMTVFNDILIPRFKAAFELSYFQAMLVQFAFFGAYFIGSLLYFLISATAGDPVARIGYKNGVILGLLVSAGGSAIFWPAADTHSYSLFLLGLFVIGIGFAMLQITANPYVTILGPERTASSRLNLAQAFNSLGTTIGPLIGGYLILQYFARTGAHGAESAKIPYAIFCVIFLVVAGVFRFTNLPHVGEGKVKHGFGALKHPHVYLGVFAIFMYVGGEVAAGSSIINFLGQKNIAGLSALDASKYVSLFWGGMLIGRFMGAVELSEMQHGRKRFLLAAIPALAFLILGLVSSWNIATHYLPLLVLCWLAFQFGKAKPDQTLVIFSATIVLLLATAILTGGRLAMWSVVGVGLFTSIGWPNIFSLALDGMGTLKSQVSSLLVMAILGGAILPPVQGKIADVIDAQIQAGGAGWLGDRSGIQIGFLVSLIAYAYVGFYGWKGHGIGRKPVDASR
jgi:MFS transporter, FHS family, L-fucose permease